MKQHRIKRSLNTCPQIVAFGSLCYGELFLFTGDLCAKMVPKDFPDSYDKATAINLEKMEMLKIPQDTKVKA